MMQCVSSCCVGLHYLVTARDNDGNRGDLAVILLLLVLLVGIKIFSCRYVTGDRVYHLNKLSWLIEIMFK